MTAVSFGAFLFSTDEVSAEGSEVEVVEDYVSPQSFYSFRGPLNSWSNSLFIIRERNGFYYEGWVTPIVQNGRRLFHESGYYYQGTLTRQTAGGPSPTFEINLNQE